MLSGLSSLTYEVTWTRRLVLVFGSTTFAVATVLSVFMGGLALGCYAAGRLAKRVRRGPLVYGILLSLEDRPIAQPGTFVGLKNFIRDFNDPIFWRVAFNTFVYTAVATVLKMMAGLDQPSNGESRLSPGFSVGILMQEPQLDETKTVRENVEDGKRELMDTIHKYNALNEKMGEPDADYEAIMAEQEPLYAVIEAQNGWEIEYSGYANETAAANPTRMQLRQGNVEVRMIISEWSVP